MTPLGFEVGAYFAAPPKNIPLQGLTHMSYAGDIGAWKGAAMPASFVFEGKMPQIDCLRSLQAPVSELTFIGVGTEFLPLAEKIRKETRFAIRVGIRAASEKWSRLPEYDDLVDAYDLLAFDFHDPQEGKPTELHTILSDPSGPSIEGAVVHYSSLGIPLKKMNLGLSTAGKRYLSVPPGVDGNGYGEKCRGPQLFPDMSFAEIERYLLEHPQARVFHTAIGGVMQSFLYNGETGDWIAFDDPDTLRGKAQWAEEMGLRGVFLWGAEDNRELHAVEHWNVRERWTKI